MCVCTSVCAVIWLGSALASPCLECWMKNDVEIVACCSLIGRSRWGECQEIFHDAGSLLCLQMLNLRVTQLARGAARGGNWEIWRMYVRILDMREGLYKHFVVRPHLILISLVSGLYKLWPRSVTIGVVLFRSGELHWVKLLQDQIWPQFVELQSAVACLLWLWSLKGHGEWKPAVRAVPSGFTAGLQIPTGKTLPN